MAEWSQLPTELLQEIASRLDSSIYTVRFRSVCSAWREAIKPRHFPNPLPILTSDGFSDSFSSFSLSKRSVFLLSLPSDNPNSSLPSYPNSYRDPNSRPWMIKTEEIKPGVVRLFNPLSRVQIKPIPPSFPNVIDLWNIRIKDLGQEHVLKCINHVLDRHSSLYMEKVAFLFRNEDDYALLTIHISGKLAMFKSSDKKWTIINDMQSPYDDVILFEGEFYAVDSNGRAVMVGVDSVDTLIPMAEPIFGGDEKYFVESGSDLLLVDVYHSLTVDSEQDEDNEEEEGEYTRKTLYFEVFKLDRDGKKWVQVMKLDDDRVLFLSDNYAFSASVNELCWCTYDANHICYNSMDNGITTIVDDPFRCPNALIVDFENRRSESLEEVHCNDNVFSPVPSWIAKDSKQEAGGAEGSQC
ncbi:hypothetical protein Ancab_028134 [Ancistrocladus abbreviatus]